MILQGIRTGTSIAKKHYSFVIFQGEGSPPCAFPSESAQVVLEHCPTAILGSKDRDIELYKNNCPLYKFS